MPQINLTADRGYCIGILARKSFLQVLVCKLNLTGVKVEYLLEVLIS